MSWITNIENKVRKDYPELSKEFTIKQGKYLGNAINVVFFHEDYTVVIDSNNETTIWIKTAE